MREEEVDGDRARLVRVAFSIVGISVELVRTRGEVERVLYGVWRRRGARAFPTRPTSSCRSSFVFWTQAEGTLIVCAITCDLE
jgi:hypothetical protein